MERCKSFRSGFAQSETSEISSTIFRKGAKMSFLKTFELRDLWAKDPALIGLWGGREVTTGTRVDHNSAMEISSFYACVRIISETVASLPCILYRRIDDPSTGSGQGQ